jgi:small subunit ribosomal protein S6
MKGWLMPLYEHVVMMRPDVSGAQVDTLIEQFKGVIEADGGSIAKSEYWGLKVLSYRIKKNRKAHFSLLNIDASHAAVSEMERQMRLNEDVLRFLTLRVDEHEDGPSVMMQKRDRRDDRRGGRSDDRPPRRDSGGRTDSTPAASTTESKSEDQGSKE